MAGISGNDDSFIAFAFAIVSIIMIFLYFPVFIGMIRDTVSYFTGDSSNKARRRRDDDDDSEGPKKKSWRVLVDDFVELPAVLFMAAQYPRQIVAGARLLWVNRGLGYGVFFWNAVRFCFRPRFIILWLWAVLLSSAMYASITFDPYSILGLPTTATESEVKKAYRLLSKLNHPDVNKTAAAKAVYPLIRKAYKALVDRDAFDKDAETEEMSVGIALPSFLTSHDHDGLILFVLLGILIGLPALIWYKFRVNTDDKLRALLMRIQTTEKQLERLYTQLGIPLDPKFVERRRERHELTEILISLNLLPPGVDDAIVESFPALSEFKKLCLTPERSAMTLAKLGLDPSTHQTLKAFFETYELGEPIRLPEGVLNKVDDVTYEACVYIIRRSQEEVEKAVNELLQLLRVLTNRMPDFRVVKRLERHHEELLETLSRVYRDSKPQARDVKWLIELPQTREELVRDVPKEIQSYFVMLRKEQDMHQQMMMQQMMGRRR